jgi:hypothetical protein
MHSAVVEEVKVHCGLWNQQEESLIIYLFYWMESERQGFQLCGAVYEGHFRSSVSSVHCRIMFFADSDIESFGPDLKAKAAANCWQGCLSSLAQHLARGLAQFAEAASSQHGLPPSAMSVRFPNCRMLQKI